VTATPVINIFVLRSATADAAPHGSVPVGCRPYQPFSIGPAHSGDAVAAERKVSRMSL
jgi:hypothetical protein